MGIDFPQNSPRGTLDAPQVPVRRKIASRLPGKCRHSVVAQKRIRASRQSISGEVLEGKGDNRAVAGIIRGGRNSVLIVGRHTKIPRQSGSQFWDSAEPCWRWFMALLPAGSELTALQESIFSHEIAFFMGRDRKRFTWGRRRRRRSPYANAN